MNAHVSPDDIRTRFSRAMSQLYRQEVPQYGTLLSLVAEINAASVAGDADTRRAMARAGEQERLAVERHGAIRLGTPEELATVCRMFRLMGMHPVGYYDLSAAGVPVHSTAFRPLAEEALQANPFRVFTSLLRLELIDDPALREAAAAILARRRIFTDRALALLARGEAEGGLTDVEAAAFVRELLQTFRWHREATVNADTYRRLHEAHRLVADVVCFKGPHINHLTPRTLDIDAAQAAMSAHGIAAKAVIEGPPRRRHAILLRQTSFKALNEPVQFVDGVPGTHTARFGEIEQRGMALTPTGRRRYDELLAQARAFATSGEAYEQALAETFAALPDDPAALHDRDLAFFRYEIHDEAAFQAAAHARLPWQLDALLARQALIASPILYEDFLPVSAAGIFQSNLGEAESRAYRGREAKGVFESALQATLTDEVELYTAMRANSLEPLRERYRTMLQAAHS
ncbi:MAG: DUF1338 family protein [Pigmentiphaga sp.]